MANYRATTHRSGARLLVLLQRASRLLSLYPGMLNELAKNCSLVEVDQMLKILTVLLSVFFVNACSTIPSGPSVLVLPGTNKDTTVFNNDDLLCRQFAHQRVTTSTIEPDSKEEGQQNYDISYIQCMYGKGHRVPVPGEIMYNTEQEWHSPPPPNMPPPPQTSNPEQDANPSQ